MAKPDRPERADWKQTTIRIDPELLARFKIALLKRKPRQSMTDWIVAAITKFVGEAENG